ncbi:MAG: 23S rRNA (guanosine(2251)-2'-O)-methyltransferase RlmB [Spirochaetia bacterium]|nr:23S rRNA (guanosine(2251)-2'-O)-methyltransferase RlmB [Spirochaetia bacterium]
MNITDTEKNISENTIQKEESFYYGLHPIDKLTEETGFFITDRLLLARSDKDARVRNIISRAKRANVKIRRTGFKAISKIVNNKNHQGILLIRTDSYDYLNLQKETIFNADKFSFFVTFDGIEDPHNLGAIIRTMAAFGSDGLILTEKNTAPLGPSAFKSSVGYLSKMPILRIKALSTFLKEARENNVYIIGASPKGKTLNEAFTNEIHKNYKSIILVLGSEAKGISENIEKYCDILSSLPMRNEVESLNISNAAAVFLYEFLGKFIKN